MSALEGLRVAIDLYKSAASTVGSLWGLYSGAFLALLGYILGSRSPVPGRAKIGLALGFLVFAASNARSLWHAQSICFVAAGTIEKLHKEAGVQLPPGISAVLQELTASPPLVVVGFQGFMTLCAVGAIWAAHIHDKWQQKNAGPKQ